MSQAAAVAPPAMLIYGNNLRLHRVIPKHDESERYEVAEFGPGPHGVWLTLGHHGQWSASFMGGVVAYSHDPELALDEARFKAVDMLRWKADDLENIGSGLW